jgi:mRNA-degrading endonuclease toxin of MazEF toxin-antitoxin module
MKRSDIWRISLPKALGHIQAGIRPAVIIQDEPALAALPTVLVIPFTSQLKTTRFSGTMLVQPDGANGLTVPSVALVFQATAVNRHDCIQHLGVLDAQMLDQLLDLLARLTGR